RVLQPIVHHDNAMRAPVPLDGNDTRAPVAGDEGGRHRSEKKRLIAVKRRRFRPVFDPRWPARPPAVTGRKERRPFAAVEQHAGDGDGRRRLASAARSEVSDADHRQARTVWLAPVITGFGNPPVETAYRAKDALANVIPAAVPPAGL